MRTQDLGERFLEALLSCDFGAIGAHLHPRVRLRALQPSGAVVRTGARPVVTRWAEWLGGWDGLTVVDRASSPVASRLRLAYYLDVMIDVQPEHESGVTRSGGPAPSHQGVAYRHRRVAMRNRWGARLGAVAAALAGLLGAVVAMPVPAWGAQPVVLTPNEGRPGDAVAIGGAFRDECLPPPPRPEADRLSVVWGTDDPEGLPFGTTLYVPDLPAGTYKVDVACSYYDDPEQQRVEIASGTAEFTVLPPPALPATVALTPTAAKPGATVTATGRNYTEKCFPDGASVRVGGSEVALASGPDRGDAGEVTVTFTVADLPAGPVMVELGCVDGVSATADLDVRKVSEGPGPGPDPGPGPGPAPGPGPGPGPGPDSGPDQPRDANARTQFVASVPLPAEVSLSPAALLVSLALFTFLFWAMGFPSEPFNKTLEKNRDRIRAWFVAHGDPRRLVPDGWGGFALYAVVAAALLTVVEPGTGLDRASWGQASTLALGFLVAVPVTTLAYCVPAELHARSAARDTAALRFLPGALVFAGACVALTRWADLQPGYVYGLFAFYAATASPLRDRVAGRGILLGSACLLAVSLAAWLAWPPVVAAATAPGASYGVLVLDAALAAVFVLGAQTLVFGLVPLTFLDGLKLKRWSAPAWALVWGISLAVLVHVLFAKFVREVADPAAAVRAAAAFLAFFALSAGCWLAFRLGGGARAPRDTVSPERLTGPITRPTDPTSRQSRAGLVVATAVLVLLVAVPATIAITGDLWGDPADEGYPAVVVDGLNVRDEPTADTARIDTLADGAPVFLRCTAKPGRYPWYELMDPHPGRYVSNLGLAFPDERRPPPC